MKKQIILTTGDFVTTMLRNGKLCPCDPHEASEYLGAMGYCRINRTTKKDRGFDFIVEVWEPKQLKNGK